MNPPPEGYDAWVEFARTATHGWHEEETKYPYDNPHFDPCLLYTSDAADDAPHQDDPNFISAVMRAHWYWRRLHCAQDLVWDTELANAARADISECPKDPEHVSSGHGNDRAWLIFVETLRQQSLVREPTP